MRKQPIALWICSLTEFWERYGFYVALGLMVLLMTKAYGLPSSKSIVLTGTFIGLVYTLSVVGGFVADKLIGHYRCVLIGQVILILGFTFLGYGADTVSVNILYLSMSFISVGTGLVKSNISSFLGHFYGNNDPLRDVGFSIFYTVINISQLFAGFCTGYLSSKLGVSFAFYTAALGALIGLITVSFITRHKLDFEKGSKQLTLIRIVLVITIIASTLMVCTYTFSSVQASNDLFIVISTITAFALGYVAIKNPKYSNNCIAYFLLILVSIIFWGLFFQIFSSLTLLIDRLVDRHILGIPIPAASFFSIEAMGVILFGRILGQFWYYMAMKNKPIHDDMKFAIAMSVLTLFYIILWICVTVDSGRGSISGYTIAGLYLFISLADLALSPIGLSVANKLCPPNNRGLFMGIWMISMGIGGKLSGVLGDILSTNKQGNMQLIYQNYEHGLIILAIISLAGLIFSVSVIPMVRRLLHRDI